MLTESLYCCASLLPFPFFPFFSVLVCFYIPMGFSLTLLLAFPEVIHSRGLQPAGSNA